MIGRRSIIAVFLVLAFGLPARSTAAPAKDDWILPKNSYLRVEESAGGQSAPQWADRVNIGWPVKVKSVNGQWLQIGDDGGYTSRGKKRAAYWVRKDDMLKIDDKDTPSTYGTQIEDLWLTCGGRIDALPRQTKAKLARLYWLRGICWERKTPEHGAEPQQALADFEAATCIDQTVADAWLRRGRWLAEINVLDGQASWESFFKEAFKQFGIAHSRKAAKAPSHGTGRASGAASKSCDPSVTACPADPLPPPADGIATLIGWSGDAPPQLYFEVGRAYQHLADAYWRIAGDNDIADVKKAADVAARKAKKAERAADDLASEVEELRKKAWRIRHDAERIAETAEAWRAKEAEIAAGRAETISAKAEADAAKAETAAAEAKASAAEAEAATLKAERAQDKYQAYFKQAQRYFQWARHSNPSWYRPPAAEADLFLARVNKYVDDNVDPINGAPKDPLSAGDLFHAARLYDDSLRLNDQFDEAHRGRADAHRLLADAPGFSDRDEFREMLSRDSELRGLLSEDDDDPERKKAQTTALDTAYESAKTASFLQSDRSATNLAARGKVEIARSRVLEANLGLLEIARASQTFSDAIPYATTVAEITDVNLLTQLANKRWYFGLGYLNAVDDRLFAGARKRATELKPCVCALVEKLSMPEQGDDDLVQGLADAIFQAQRAIAEIDEITPLGDAEADDRGANALAPGCADALPLATKTESHTAKAYDEPWPSAVTTIGELLARNPRIRTWDHVFERLEELAEKQLKNDRKSKKERSSTLHDDLEKCSREWSDGAP